MQQPLDRAQRGRRAIEVAVFLSIVVLAIELRALGAWHEPLIGDEIFSRDLVARSWSGALAAAVEDAVHPPLYYVGLKLWRAALGDDPFVLRLFSVLGGAVAVALTWRLAKRLFRDWRAGALCALIVAVSEPQVLYGHVTRSYAWFAAIALWMASSLLRALDDPTSRTAWPRYAASVAVIGYTHYVGWLYALATLPAVLATRSRAALGRWALATAAAFALFAPWAVAVVRELAGRGLAPNLGWIELPPLESLAWIYAKLGGVPAMPRGATVALTLAAALFVAAFWDLARAERKSGVERAALIAIACVAALPPALLFLSTLPPLALPIWGMRHLLPSQALWTIVLIAGVVALARRRRLIAGTVAAALVALAISPTTVHGDESFPPYPRIASFLAQERNAADRSAPIHTTASYSIGLPLRHYLGSPDAVLALPDSPGECPDRLWVVYRPWLPVEDERVRALERSGFRVGLAKDFARPTDGAHAVRVVLLRRESTAR